MEITRTHCETIKVDEEGVHNTKFKTKYETLDDAVIASAKMNSKPKVREKVVPYKCTVCHQYHIGRNGKENTDKSRKKALILLENHKIEEKIKKVKSIKFTVVGKIDLSKVPNK